MLHYNAATFKSYDKMADKTYLNVPYAQKDAAKALGARWDPANKKWYVPAGKDLTPFAGWQAELTPLTESVSPSGGKRLSASTKNQSSGVFTHAANNDFVAYCGSEPPWD